MLELYDEIEDNFLLFGIQTPIFDEARFAYLLNNIFEWKLRRINDLDIIFDNETYCFSSFFYTPATNQEDYIYLIKNQSHEKFEKREYDSLFQDINLTSSRALLGKYNMYNFLIKVPEEIDPEEINKLTNTTVDFIYNIQLLTQISKKEEKYFLI